MGSRKWAVIGLESRAASARVTNHFVTIFSQTYNKYLAMLCKNIHNNAVCILTNFYGFHTKNVIPKSF